MNPHVSIIIPSKNSSKTIKKLLDSIFAEYDKSFFEVIVVDSSNDSTPNILKKFPVRIFRLPFTKQRNATISRNIGISNSRGDFIYFLDADSFLEKNWQYHLKKIIKSGIQIFGGPVSTRGNIFDFYCQKAIKSPMRHIRKSYKIYKSNFYNGNWPLAANLGIKKEVFDKIGKFDKNMENYEEVDLLWRACQKNIEIHMLPFPKVIHSYRKSIIDGIKTYFRYGNGFGKFVVKYPLNFLSIYRVLFILLSVSLALLLIFSAIFARKDLQYFLLPIIGLYGYYLTINKFNKKILLLPFFDLIYLGISYSLGVLYSIFSKLLKKN